METSLSCYSPAFLTSLWVAFCRAKCSAVHLGCLQVFPQRQALRVGIIAFALAAAGAVAIPTLYLKRIEIRALKMLKRSLDSVAFRTIM